jgi:phosphoserine phosphatase
MKKQRINVIDLDKTLVNFDTFRELVLREIKNGKFAIISLTILRIARLISSSGFKKSVQNYLKKNYPKSFFTDYAAEIYRQLNPEVIELIKQNTDKDTINILLSASPNEYVQPLYEMLKWQGSGSYFDEKNKFHHLYGIEKLSWLEKFYPNTRYQYYFAISDSKTDYQLLDLFKHNLLFKKN